MKSDGVRSILLVDDEPDMREMLAFEFESKGFQVLCAGNGREAAQLLSAHQVDAVVTDVRMPHIQGFELLEQSKNHNVHAPAFILMSAYPDVMREQVYAMGAEALFTKPFRLARLVDTVSALVQPLESRWMAESERDTLRHLKIQGGIWPGEHFVLGRGGCAAIIKDILPVVEEWVRFEVSLEAAPFSGLSGVGVVRWVRTIPGAAECGIEFYHLNNKCRAAFLEWVSDTHERAYIPVFPSHNSNNR